MDDLKNNQKAVVKKCEDAQESLEVNTCLVLSMGSPSSLVHVRLKTARCWSALVASRQRQSGYCCALVFSQTRVLVAAVLVPNGAHLQASKKYLEKQMQEVQQNFKELMQQVCTVVYCSVILLL